MKGEPAEILLVEDNPEHAELIIRAFHDQRVINPLVHVEDGEAALDYLYQRRNYAHLQGQPLPHIILLDLRLPKVDGIEVLKTIKSDNSIKHIPVVILTSSSADRDIMQAYDNYVNSYLVKPIDFQSLAKLMSDLGFYWLFWNRTIESEKDSK
jgi:CheY-like chemotaxis protein